MEAELTYERALELLDQRLAELEEGRLSLEDALKAVDQARAYLKVCEDKLEEARHRIEVRGEDQAAAPAEPTLDPPLL